MCSRRERARKSQRRVGIRGTRIPAAAVFENLEDGLTIDEIVQMFDGLTREQVRALLDFAAESLSAPAVALDAS